MPNLLFNINDHLFKFLASPFCKKANLGFYNDFLFSIHVSVNRVCHLVATIKTAGTYTLQDLPPHGTFSAIYRFHFSAKKTISAKQLL